MSRIKQVIKRTGALVPFNRQRISNAIYRAAVAVGGRDRQTAERLASQVVELLEQETPESATPTVEDIQNVVERVLIENGHARTAKAYILYRDERTRRRDQRASRSARSAENIPWRKIWEVLDWASRYDLDSVESLAARLERGEFAQIVHESEKAYQEDIVCAAEMMRERRHQLKIVIIAGPSSSGKTTTTIKLGQLLEQMGLSLVPLTVDHYFFDLEMHPKDEHGDYDYETPQALDLGLINEHLVDLIAGKEVRIPFYDFKTGRQYRDHTPMRIGENDVILIDSLHGLYEPMTVDVPPEKKFKLYIEPLLQMRGVTGRYLRWTDLRLMRRMVRDQAFRAYDPQSTLEHWHYVRASEMRNIFPNIGSTDYIVNSAMPYELPVMKGRLFEHFQRWPALYENDPLRQDAYERAVRVSNMLQSIPSIADEEAIPEDSLMREFIGGSCYDYH